MLTAEHGAEIGREPKKDRVEAISRKASEVAASGKYRTWLDIEFALTGEGYTEAGQVLDRAVTREHLSKVCDANWKGPSNA